MNFVYDWFTDIRPSMERWVPKDAKDIVEIGSFEGRSTVWFAEWCKNARITCVDHFKGGEDQKILELSNLYERFLFNTSDYENRISVIKESSWTAWPNMINDLFDVAFVDGSHVACDVLMDLVNAFRCVNVGGLIIADDYTWENQRADSPRVAIDMFLHCFSQNIEVLETSRVVVMKKLCSR